MAILGKVHINLVPPDLRDVPACAGGKLPDLMKIFDPVPGSEQNRCSMCLFPHSNLQLKTQVADGFAQLLDRELFGPIQALNHQRGTVASHGRSLHAKRREGQNCMTSVCFSIRVPNTRPGSKFRPGFVERLQNIKGVSQIKNWGERARNVRIQASTNKADAEMRNSKVLRTFVLRIPLQNSTYNKANAMKGTMLLTDNSTLI